MANSVHNHSTHLKRPTAGQQPILLARLPRIGAAQPSNAQPSNAQPSNAQPSYTQSANPQAVPPPELIPQLDLRSEIDQRVRLHVADAPTEQGSAPSHFADRRHTVERGPILRQPSPAPTKRHSSGLPNSSKKQQAHAMPSVVSEKLFDLHAQLVPHASLIVALALIASAGLLYWMIVGPAQVPMPHYENFGSELRDEGFGANTNYLPEFSSAVPQVDETTNSSDQLTVIHLPALPQFEQTQAEQTQPESTSPTLQEPSSNNDSGYPSTGYRDALDFTQIGPSLPSQNTSDLPRALPEVAERPTTSIIR